MLHVSFILSWKILFVWFVAMPTAGLEMLPAETKTVLGQVIGNLTRAEARFKY